MFAIQVFPFLTLSQGEGMEDSQIIIKIAWQGRADRRELCLIRHMLAIVTSRKKGSFQNISNRKVRFGTCRWFSVSDCNRKQKDWFVMATFQEGRANFSLLCATYVLVLVFSWIVYLLDSRDVGSLNWTSFFPQWIFQFWKPRRLFKVQVR